MFLVNFLSVSFLSVVWMIFLGDCFRAGIGGGGHIYSGNELL